MAMMIQIRLDSVDRVLAFIRVIDHYRLRMLLHSGRVCVNPHSILGILCLNLCNPLDLEIEQQDEETLAVNNLLSDIKCFLSS